MGVRGLETFASQYVRKGVVNVNIIDQIKSWKKKNFDKEPFILIDLRELFIALTQIDVREVYYGGRHNIYLEKLDNFFSKLIEVGAKLIFFKKGGGSSYFHENLELMLEERYQKYVEDLKSIDAGTFVLNRSNGRVRTSLGTDLMAIAEKYGEYHYSINGNAAIAVYAKVHSQVFAILAKDSDFLAYHSSIQYWSCSYSDLNFSLFKTKMFNVDALHKSLCLTSSQVTLFVAIMSFYERYQRQMKKFLHDPKGLNNQYKWDIVPPKYNKKLSYSIQRIQRIASFVWTNWQPELDFHELTKDIVCGHVNEEMVAYLQSEYKKYDIDNFELSIATDPLIRRIGYYDFAYNILNDMIHQVYDISFADFRHESGIPYNDLCIPICRKLAGIFLQHKNDESLKCKFWVKETHDQPLKEVLEVPVYPEFSVEVAQLFDLFDEKDNSDTTEAVKWKLLFWTFSLELGEESISFLQTIPETYFVSVLLTIMYLLKSKAINILEADALLLAEWVSKKKDFSDKLNDSDNCNDAESTVENKENGEHSGEKKNVEKTDGSTEGIKQIENAEETDGSTEATKQNDTVVSANTIIAAEFSDKMNGRTIRIAHLYNVIRNMTNICLRSCGLKRLVEIPQFDGLYFHNAVEVFQQSQHLYERNLSNINQYRVYV